jgi:hypothetical protein
MCSQETLQGLGLASWSFLELGTCLRPITYTCRMASKHLTRELKGRPTIEIATISHHYQRLCKRCRRLVSLSSHALDLGAVATTARLHMDARQTAGAVRVG